MTEWGTSCPSLSTSCLYLKVMADPQTSQEPKQWLLSGVGDRRTSWLHTQLWEQLMFEGCFTKCLYHHPQTGVAPSN